MTNLTLHCVRVLSNSILGKIILDGGSFEFNNGHLVLLGHVTLRIVEDITWKYFHTEQTIVNDSAVLLRAKIKKSDVRNFGRKWGTFERSAYLAMTAVS